jgi:hypothetical protein
MVFSTLDEQVTVDNTVRLADAFLTALNAKKTNAASNALYDRPWTQEPLLPFATVARAPVCGGKVRCAAPTRLFQKKWLKSLVFYTVCVGGSTSIQSLVSQSCLLLPLMLVCHYPIYTCK